MTDAIVHGTISGLAIGAGQAAFPAGERVDDEWVVHRAPTFEEDRERVLVAQPRTVGAIRCQGVKKHQDRPKGRKPTKAVPVVCRVRLTVCADCSENGVNLICSAS